MTLTTPKIVSLPCPLGCTRTVAAEGKEIHFCVIRTGKHIDREYVGTLDGVYVCSGGSNIEVETQLNDHVLSLIQDGLVDTPLALLNAGPTPSEPSPGLEDNDDGMPNLPNMRSIPGRAIARMFHRDRARFLGVLRGLDRVAWIALAEHYAAYMGCVTPAHALRVWAKAVDADIALPPRAA